MERIHRYFNIRNTEEYRFSYTEYRNNAGSLYSHLQMLQNALMVFFSVVDQTDGISSNMGF